MSHVCLWLEASTGTRRRTRVMAYFGAVALAATAPVATASWHKAWLKHVETLNFRLKGKCVVCVYARDVLACSVGTEAFVSTARDKEGG